MASPLQLAIRNAIGEALYAADSDDTGLPHAAFPHLARDAETGKLPNDPRDWLLQQLNECPLTAAECQLIEQSDHLVALARLGPADIVAILSQASAPAPANSGDIARLAARCLTVALDHQWSIAHWARWEPYAELLRQAREAQGKLRKLMPLLIAPLKGSKYSAEISVALEFETFAEQLEKLDLSEPTSGITRRVWEPGARELAGVYRDIVDPNTGWSRNGPAVRFLVEVLRRAYPGTNPTAAAIESLLARRGLPDSVTRSTEWVLDAFVR